MSFLTAFLTWVEASPLISWLGPHMAEAGRTRRRTARAIKSFMIRFVKNIHHDSLLLFNCWFLSIALNHLNITARFSLTSAIVRRCWFLPNKNTSFVSILSEHLPSTKENSRWVTWSAPDKSAIRLNSIRSVGSLNTVCSLKDNSSLGVSTNQRLDKLIIACF